MVDIRGLIWTLKMVLHVGGVDARRGSDPERLVGLEAGGLRWTRGRWGVWSAGRLTVRLRVSLLVSLPNDRLM